MIGLPNIKIGKDDENDLSNSAVVSVVKFIANQIMMIPKLMMMMMMIFGGGVRQQRSRDRDLNPIQSPSHISH